MTSHPVARLPSSRWWLARMARPVRVSSRPSRTCSASLRLHLQDPSLAALRVVQADVSIHGWFDAWCLGWARFEWEGGEVWGWDGLISGERSALRIVPEHDAAIVLLTNSSSGRALYRTLFTELMPRLFGITVPSLRLDPSPGSAGDLARFAGVYGWPDRDDRGHGRRAGPPHAGGGTGNRGAPDR